MKGLLFVKLGGSLITDKSTPYTVRRQTLDRLCQELREAHSASNVPLLLGHGAGSFGHVTAARHGTHRGVHGPEEWRGFAEVNRDAARLNALVREALERAGEAAVSLQPSAACIARAGRIVSYAVEPVRRLLDVGVMPVVHGDACLDEAQGGCIISTEEILHHLCPLLRPDRIILAGKVDGVLGPDGALLRRITPDSFEGIRAALNTSDGVADVTGGMLQKVQLALQWGVPTEIINGGRPGLLRRALQGERGLGTEVCCAAPTF